MLYLVDGKRGKEKTAGVKTRGVPLVVFLGVLIAAYYGKELVN